MVVTEIAPRVNGVGCVTVPVNVGEAIGAYAVLVNALEPRVPPAPTFNVEPSVPAKVNVLLNVAILAEAILVPRYIASHAVLAVLTIEIQVQMTDVLPAKTTTVVASDAVTVTAPVELLLISNVCPRTSVLVTGSTTVWVSVPVKNCCCVLFTVKVVEAPAVAVVV